MRRGNSSISNCHHQSAVVSSEANSSSLCCGVYGLPPVQSGRLSRDVTERVQWVRFLWKSGRAVIHILYIENTDCLSKHCLALIRLHYEAH
jgi:hypothetical protein